MIISHSPYCVGSWPASITCCAPSVPGVVTKRHSAAYFCPAVTRIFSDLQSATAMPLISSVTFTGKDLRSLVVVVRRIILPRGSGLNATTQWHTGLTSRSLSIGRAELDLAYVDVSGRVCR